MSINCSSKAVLSIQSSHNYRELHCNDRFRLLRAMWAVHIFSGTQIIRDQLIISQYIGIYIFYANKGNINLTK